MKSVSWPIPASSVSVAVRLLLLGAGAACCTAEAFADEGPDVAAVVAAPEAELETVTVSSRYREESAQSVPIPITVLGAIELQRDGTVALQDLVKQAPGLQATTPNSRRTGISLRGIGKSAGNDALEASMGVIVDGVFLTHPGMTYLDFTDLERIEVLHGPQGTLLGKNTTVGALNYVSKAPSTSPEGSVNLSFGERNARTFSGAYSDSLVDGLLSYRASGFFSKQDGFIQNVNPEGGTTNEKNRSGGKLQFAFTPTDSFSALLSADWSQTNERSNTKPVIRVLTNYDDAAATARVTTPGGTTVPTTSAQVTAQNRGTNTLTSLFARNWFGGYQPVIGSWTEEDLNLNVPVVTENLGAGLTLNWDLGPVTLTEISASRRFAFDAKNDADQSKFDTGRNGSKVDAGQTSHELRLASQPGGRLEYQAGLYYLHAWNTSTGRNLYGVDSGAYSSRNGDYNLLSATGVGRQLLQASLNRVYVPTTITPDTKSYAGFGQVNWKLTSAATITLGLRETIEERNSSSTKSASFIDGLPLDDLTVYGNSIGASALQIASAQNIRTTTIGTTYGKSTAAPLKNHALSWLISPTYKLSEDVLLYASVASGEKSGAIQFSSTGVQQNVAPEKVRDFELGIKSQLLERRLRVNANLYRTQVRGYQQTTSIFDQATTTLRNDGTLYYASRLGNIPGIRAQGVELDLAWAVTQGVRVTLGGNYNDAIYSDWHTATCPSELNIRVSNVVCDNTGKQIVAAPRLTISAGADLKHSITPSSTGHAWFNTLNRTKQNFDNNLSRYGVQGGYAVTDVGIGLLTHQDRVEIDLVAKNVFDRRYTTSVNVGSDGSIGYDGIGDPRWVGIVFHARLQ